MTMDEPLYSFVNYPRLLLLSSSNIRKNHLWWNILIYLVKVAKLQYFSNYFKRLWRGLLWYRKLFIKLTIRNPQEANGRQLNSEISAEQTAADVTQNMSSCHRTRSQPQLSIDNGLHLFIPFQKIHPCISIILEMTFSRNSTMHLYRIGNDLFKKFTLASLSYWKWYGTTCHIFVLRNWPPKRFTIQKPALSVKYRNMLFNRSDNSQQSAVSTTEKSGTCLYCFEQDNKSMLHCTPSIHAVYITTDNPSFFPEQDMSLLLFFPCAVQLFIGWEWYQSQGVLYKGVTTVLVCKYFSRPSMPMSLPNPLILYPPNGASGSNAK